jgi:hypothetical protein
MGSEQVAAVLRQSGTQVRLVVARPIEPTSPDYQVTQNIQSIQIFHHLIFNFRRRLFIFGPVAK